MKFTFKSVDKMLLCTIIFPLICFICLTDCKSFTCGPGGICVCDLYNRMNCSDTNIKIQDVCGFIGNLNEHSVSILYLEGNGYKSIEGKVLQGCGNLHELFLGGNQINSVGKDAFLILDNLKLLDLSNNSLPIYDETFQGRFKFPPHIETLRLNRNLNVSGHHIRTAYPDLSSLSHLEVLFIDGLKDKIFPVSYRKIKTLKTVVMSGLNGQCNISHITNFTLQYLPSVRTLSISSCSIETIHAGAFRDLSNLENLDLSQNLGLGFRMLRNISYGLQFTNIKFLNYSKVYNTFGIGTWLRKQDFCYFWNTTLDYIDMSRNRIQLVETNAQILIPKTLKKLRAEDNKFTFGPYLLQLGCMQNLEEFYGNYQNTAHDPRLYETEPSEKMKEGTLDNSDCPYIEDSFLRKLSKSKKGCPFLENDKIDLKNPTFPDKFRRVEFAQCDMQYSITSFPIFPQPKDIEYLDFSGNILHSWIGPVGPIPKLKYLNLSRNYCSCVGIYFFKSFKNVINLQLQQNFLGLVFSDSKDGSFIFDPLEKLKVLNLSSNIISYIPTKIFSRLSKLERLDLSVNNIETWTIDVSSLDGLLHLNLKLNFFHTLPSVLRDKLESNARRLGKTFTIDLRNNTFTVNCDNKEYLEWMVKHKNNFLYFKDYIFHNKTGASISAEQFVEDVNSLDKECRSYTVLIVLCSIAISVFLAVVISGFIYRNRWKLRYLMRITKIRHLGYTKLHNDPNELEHFQYDAFISYANEDLRFILDKAFPKLEAQGMKICLHDKDFLPGNNIADNIVDAIRNSRKTVVILSKCFLKSKWCLYEFNMARMESIYSREGANCLLVVMLEPVLTTNMTTEMLDWIKSNTYIEYSSEEEGELLFWNNLKEALKD